MSYHLKLTVAAAAALLAPGAALAQTASSDIQLGSIVAQACGLGAPEQILLDLGDLTGPDGKLDSSKTGATTLATTVIPNAWCNSPHSIKLQAVPMSLQGTKPYAQPAYMSRDVTYDATLLGWPLGLTRRSLTGDDGMLITSPGAFSPLDGMRLNVARLNSLTAAKAEQTGLMLESGTYRGTVTITLSTVN